jgi:hypothetical protein
MLGVVVENWRWCVGEVEICCKGVCREDVDLFSREKGPTNLPAGNDVRLKALCAMTMREDLYILSFVGFTSSE